MDSYLSEESLWASGFGARLRLTQTAFAGDSPQARPNFLYEEIERGLKDVVPSKRPRFLQALAERFPAWEESAPPAQPATMPGQPADESPEALLARLIEKASSLSPEARDEFARKLQQAGLGPKAGVDFFLEIPPEYQKKLALPAGRPLNPERTIKLLGALCEMTAAMDQLVWALWKQIAPQSNIRKEGEFLKLTGPYLVGDTEVSTQQVVQLLERTRKMIASLLGAIGRGSANYVRKHVSQFAPDVIEDLARIEKKAWEGLDALSWKKYAQLAKEHATEPVIENEIQKGIAKAAENLMVGRAVP